MDTANTNPTTAHAPVKVSLVRFVGYFLRLGTLGFGGPIALAGHMQQDLVEARGWVSKQDYVEGLALAQLAPGPLAAQLAIYLGYVRAGILGATAVGVAFVLPSFLMVLGLSAAYVHFGGLPWMQGLFYGIGAAVIGIIARSAYKLVRLTVKRDRVLWTVFAASALVTGWTGTEIVWLFLLSGVVVVIARRPSRAATLAFLPLLPDSWLTTGLQAAAGSQTLVRITWFFAEAGAFVFGSGLAI